MILCLISIALIIFNIFCFWKSAKSCLRYNNWELSGMFSLALGVILILLLIVIKLSYCIGADASIYKAQQEREAIIVTCNQSLQTNDLSIVDKQTLISSIYDWNSECYSQKYWANNLWTNWLCSQKIADAYVEISLEEVGLK